MEKIKQRFTKTEKSWMLYDWANSAYSILVAALLPIYINGIGEAAGYDAAARTSNWGLVVALSALLVAVLAPILGAIADYRGMRKKMFAGFFLVAVIATALMPTVTGYLVVLLLYAVTNIGFAGANVFYDAFLVDVTTTERMDRVSSWGFALGYIGGSTIPFVISIALYMLSADLLGVLALSGTAAIKISCILTALWWAVFTLPLLRNVKQVSYIEREPHVIRSSFKRLGQTLKEIRREKPLLLFFLAYFCYINGVGAIIMMASNLADNIGFSTLYIVGGLFLTQIVAFPCSILYDKLGERFTHKTMILVGVCTYVVVCCIGFFMYYEWQFLVLAALVGTAQGGIQALSRAYFGKLIPDKRRSGEFFGFYNIFGKFESVLGTLLMAIVAMFTEDIHYCVIPVLALFIIGGILLLKVPDHEKKS